MSETLPAQEIFYPHSVAIDAQTFFPNPGEQQREFSLKGNLVAPESNHAETAVLFIHGAAGADKNPVETYAQFQYQLAQDAGISSLVFHSRGVGTGTNRSDEEFSRQSFNDRSDDALNALFSLDDITHPKSIIVSGVSMGGHIVIKMLDKLHEIASTQDHPKRHQALHLLTVIKGIGLYAPAAYPASTEYLPAVPPTDNPDDPDSRTTLLRSFSDHPEMVLEKTDIFRLLHAYRYKWPVWVAFGEHDMRIPKAIQQAYKNDVFLPDEHMQEGQLVPGNFQIVSGAEHEGLLGQEFRGLHEQFMAFSQNVSN